MSDVSLTPEQIEIVCAPPDQNLVVTAVAGSGKTTALTFRANAIVASGVEPQRVLVLAYTRAAAAIARMRINAITPGVTVLTIHGLCLWLLQEHAERLFDRGVLPLRSFGVGTEAEMLRLRREVAKEMDRSIGNEKVQAEARRRMLRHGLLPMEQLLWYGRQMLVATEPYGDEDGQVRARLSYFLPWTHLLVDEAQDLSAEQWGIIETLRQLHGMSVTVVGDEAQAIYGFLGAASDMYRAAVKQWPTRLTLSKNWRSRPEIVALANRVLDAMKETTTPHLEAGRAPEADPETVQVFAFPDEEAELFQACETAAELSQDRRVAILTRYNDQVSTMAQILGGMNASFYRPGATHGMWSGPNGELAVTALRAVYEQRDGDLLMLLRSSLEDWPAELIETHQATALAKECPLLDVLWEAGDEAVKRLVWWPAVIKEYTGESLADDVESAVQVLRLPPELCLSCIVWCRERGDGKHSVSEFLRHLPFMGAHDDVPIANLCLSTIHGAKGGEWDAVIVTGLVEGRLPGRENAIEEERRLFYVAVTRAKELLVLTHHAMGTAADGRPVRRYLSRFLREVGLG